MKRFARAGLLLLSLLTLTACSGAIIYSGSRTGNDSELVMEFNMFNGIETQDLQLEPGDYIHAEAELDRGTLSIKIQKGSDLPVYENSGIAAPCEFDVAPEEAGVYAVTVTGSKAEGNLRFTVENGSAVPATPEDAAQAAEALHPAKADRIEIYGGDGTLLRTLDRLEELEQFSALLEEDLWEWEYAEPVEDSPVEMSFVYSVRATETVLGGKPGEDERKEAARITLYEGSNIALVELSFFRFPMELPEETCSALRAAAQAA